MKRLLLSGVFLMLGLGPCTAYADHDYGIKAKKSTVIVNDPPPFVYDPPVPGPCCGQTDDPMVAVTSMARGYELGKGDAGAAAVSNYRDGVMTGAMVTQNGVMLGYIISAKGGSGGYPVPYPYPYPAINNQTTNIPVEPSVSAPTSVPVPSYPSSYATTTNLSAYLPQRYTVNIR